MFLYFKFSIFSSFADSIFELCSMLFNVAMWLMKHAAKVASGDKYVFLV